MPNHTDALSEALARIAKLEEDNATLTSKARKAATSRVMFKVSPKGGLSVYGLQRFPVTLYPEQWMRLFSIGDDLIAFAKDHADEFAVKPAIAIANPVTA